ncbi:23S rRNA m(2)G2445 methyltransferase [Planctomycetes bacterium K23_9]|uniref:23S rRNA m(2)G2445 methyltransferase n=2 Tax=Stieleria marina TaxID=1930275 RepID=A0A517P0X4_9BACT|nr:23S rRNA m(2)G2445 methyltransferase [Planctomycetes bacterium K23_9]
MPVQPTPYGHIGIFPEQYSNWQWLADSGSTGGDSESTSDVADESQSPRSALNLFAYTGASTMALVSAGYQVAHVDAAKPSVQAARAAADANEWSNRPIRYLVDDAASFVAREVRRQRVYDTIVLDPPAYGHSPKGKAWRLERDLWPLLEDCLTVVDVSNFRILVTGHSPAVTTNEIVDFLGDQVLQRGNIKAGDCQIQRGRSILTDESIRRLDAGFFVRFECRLES